MANSRRHRAQDHQAGQDYGSGPSELSSTSQTSPYLRKETHANPKATPEPRKRTSESTAEISVSPKLCQCCTDGQQTQLLAQQVAHELAGLLAGIRRAMMGESVRHCINSDVESKENQLDPAQNSLRGLVLWIANSIEASLRILNSSSLPSVHGDRQSLPLRDSAKISHFNMGAKRKSPFNTADAEQGSILFSSHPPKDPRSREGSSALYLSDEDHASKTSDESPPLKSHSSRPSPGNVAPSQTIIQPPPDSRVLPLLSPKMATTLMLPPVSSSPTSSATYAAHIHTLQQHIDTRTLAFETLQRDHQILLSAFSRSQSQAAVLDKKLLASQAEISELNDGRLGLQVQITALEAEVQEIQQIREDAHTRSITEGAQYMQIMAMSSKLQAQGASDLHKWKNERGQWELEKKGFTMQISLLENEKQILLRKIHGSEQLQLPLAHNQSAAMKANSGVDTSRRMQQDEFKELRVKCNMLEAVVDALRQTSNDFGQAFIRLGVVGKHLQQQLQSPPSEAFSQERPSHLSVERTDCSMSED